MRQPDAKLGWVFTPAHDGIVLAGERWIGYSIDGLGYRVPSRDAPVDVNQPSILFTGESIIADLIRVPELRIGSILFRDVTIAFVDVPPFKLFGLEKGSIGTSMSSAPQSRSMSFFSWLWVLGMRISVR